jgi:pyruvate/2-oxoacid:ferredoxin oxidoreductase beta subunit
MKYFLSEFRLYLFLYYTMRTNLNKFQRCPGCGNYLVHTALKQALMELNIPKYETVIVTGV